MSFAIGDRVRVVSRDGHYTKVFFLAIGDLVTVQAAPDDEGDVELVTDKGRHVWAHESDLVCGAAPQLVPSATAEQLAELLVAFAAIGPNARKLLLSLAQRLVKGAKEHGDFDSSTKRVWTREALEEDLDGIVYRALELQERTEQR